MFPVGGVNSADGKLQSFIFCVDIWLSVFVRFCFGRICNWWITLHHLPADIDDGWISFTENTNDLLTRCLMKAVLDLKYFISQMIYKGRIKEPYLSSHENLNFHRESWSGRYHHFGENQSQDLIAEGGMLSIFKSE